MVEMGRLNRLQVVNRVDFGYYLDGGEAGEILLPNRVAPEGLELNQWLEVFVYLDSDDRPIATTQRPRVMVGECAFLKVVDSNRVGAFLDWGLPKDLLLPFAEQQQPAEKGRAYAVYVYLDPRTHRIVATTRLSRHLEEESRGRFKPGQEVSLLVCGRSKMGYKVVIEGTHLGLLYKDEVFQPLTIGKRIKGYIKHIRDEDERINVTLQRPGGRGHDELSQRILDHLKAEGGSSPLTDRSPPEAIYAQFGVSKKNYKKALGTLYKAKKVLLEADCVRLA